MINSSAKIISPGESNLDKQAYESLASQIQRLLLECFEKERMIRKYDTTLIPDRSNNFTVFSKISVPELKIEEINLSSHDNPRPTYTS